MYYQIKRLALFHCLYFVLFLQTPITSPFATPPMSPSRPPLTSNAFSNPSYNPFIDAAVNNNNFNPREVTLQTIPNTIVTIRHAPNVSEPDDFLFHDTSVTNRNFVPSSQNTTVVNIHPAPRIATDPNTSFAPLLTNIEFAPDFNSTEIDAAFPDSL